MKRYRWSKEGMTEREDGDCVYLSDAKQVIADRDKEIKRLIQRLLTAAGDDLCRLTQEEIKAYTSGEVQIPPEEEFIPSCRQFWRQAADRTGVLKNCLTLAQLVAENEKLRETITKCREVRNELSAEARTIEDKINADGYHGNLDEDELEAETIWKCVRRIPYE